MKRELILIILIIGIVYALALNTDIDIGGDDANYILLTRSILSGRGYADIQSPTPTAHTAYPPLFPLILCPLMLVFGENVLIFKLIPFISILAAIYVFFLILKDYGPKNDLWIIAIFGLNPAILSLAVTPLSEGPYFLFSFLALLLLNKYQAAASPVNKYLWFTLLTMIISFYTRTIGIVLLPTAFVFLAFKREFKKAFLISTLFLAGIFPWILRSFLTGSTYIGVLFTKDTARAGSGMITVNDFLFRTAHNFIIYGGKVFADIFFYPYFENVTKDHAFFIFKLAISLILFALVLYGGIKKIKTKITPVSLYVIFVLIVCISWPVHGPRFISPIFAFLVLFLFSGVEAMAGRKRYMFNAMAVIILLPALFADSRQIYEARSGYRGPESRSYFNAMEWIRRNTPEKSKIMCKKPAIMFLRTGRKAIYYPPTRDTKTVLRTIEENGIDYVVFDAIGRRDARFGMWSADRFLRPVITEYPDRFTPVFSIPEQETYVYKVTRKIILLRKSNRNSGFASQEYSPLE